MWKESVEKVVPLQAMKTNGYQQKDQYSHYVVREAQPLLEWLLENLNLSRSKVKATLQGRGIKVNGKTVTQL